MDDEEEEWVAPAAPQPKKEEAKQEEPKKEEPKKEVKKEDPKKKKSAPPPSPRPVKEAADASAKPEAGEVKDEGRAPSAPSALREAVTEEAETSAAKRARIDDFQRKISALHRE